MKDSGSIVLGWLTKVVLLLSLLGVIAFDGIAIVTATFKAADHATHVAVTAADAYKSTKNVQKAYDAAAAEAELNLETVDPATFKVNDKGRVSLEVHREATTLWMKHIGFLKKYTRVSGTGEGSPTP